MSPEWSKLRAWEGSQQKAFEELCCQLAAAEPTPDGRFTRKGTPDAGIECFWAKPNGDESAWQAKFFFQLQEVQWRDLDHSVQQALEKHPQMVQYYVCLPLDLADPRLTDKKTKKKKTFAQDTWNLRVKKWKQWAADRDMQVQFEYWGNHEIWTRLTKDEHRGRLLFWFNEQWFSEEWLGQRIEEAHKNAGRRYMPSLHVALDLERAFDALGRGEGFFRRLSDRLGNVRREFDDLRTDSMTAPTLQEPVGELTQLVHELSGIAMTPRSAIEALPLAKLAQLADRGGELAFRLVDGLSKPTAQSNESSTAKESYSYERHLLYSLQDRFAELKGFLRSPEAIVANTGALLLVGDAGTGKTHMLCEIARNRQEAGKPTVLLLGEQFAPGEPWSQMLNMLGVQCSRDEFLGALEAVADARGTRAVILIDAINEEHGREIWPAYLPGVLVQISRHPRIGIALSVRSSYEKSVVPEQLESDGVIVRFVHSGFEGQEEEGVDKYFAHYGIALPSLPILDPEFSNPLFLRVLCEGLQNRGLSRIPEGLNGFVAIFRFFLDSVNEKLARPNLLDYDVQQPIVLQSIERLVTAMVAKETDWLDRSAASEILEAVLPRTGFDKSLFRRLVDEGVISEELVWIRPSGRTPATMTSLPVVRFQYQRFSDYLIVKHLLSPHIGTGRPEAAFEPREYLGKILADPLRCRQNQGIVEALAVLTPETTGRELPILAPHCTSFDSVKEAVAVSLVWRRADSISTSTWSYLEQAVLPDSTARQALLRTLILVAPDPSHPYNARFLSKWLFPMQMAERDALWSTALASGYPTGGATARLLRWSESLRNRTGHNSSVITLVAMVLSWLLTSSNRLLRDRTTKALVGLLQSRLPTAGDLVAAFAAVNDDYVLERVAAAAYGAAMRSRSPEQVANLAMVCYERFFKHTRPPLNALIRDYLRGIVELALYDEPSISVDAKRIRPPYGAPLPDGFDLDRTTYPDLGWDAAKGLPSGTQSVHHSIVADDFNSYVLQPLCGKFFTAKLGDPIAPTRREVYDQFRSGLSAPQAEAWERYRGPQVDITQLMEHLLSKQSAHRDVQQADGAPDLTEVCAQFEATLGAKQKDLFRRQIRPYVEEGYPGQARNHVALAAIQHFVLEKVIAMGWHQALDDFDKSSVISRGRSEHKVERIGKKYQWIAYYQLVGLLSDNFQCASESYDGIGQYEGPWQVRYGRNIDPSLLIRRKAKAEGEACWWAPAICESWGEELDEPAWLRLDSDLPKIDETFLMVREPGQSEWIVLEGHYKWTQPTAPGREYLELPQRQIGYNVTSCLVRAKNASSVLKGLLNTNLLELRSSEPRTSSDAFLGEMHWAPAYTSELNSYYGYDEWTKDSLPHPILITTEHYYSEPGSFDASMDESVTLPSPAHWLVKEMGLRWSGIEGDWCTGTPYRTVFSDPSAHSPGPTVLLASRNDLEQFLREHGCVLIWIITGTKWAIGGGFLVEPTGRRLIMGALRMNRRSISGEVKSWLELPHGSESS